MIGLGIGENVFGDSDNGHELWGQDATTRRKERREKSACLDDALQIGIEDRSERQGGRDRGRDGRREESFSLSSVCMERATDGATAPRNWFEISFARL